MIGINNSTLQYELTMNELIWVLLKFAYWMVARLPRRIESHLRPTLDGWTRRYMLRQLRQLRQNITRIRTDVVRRGGTRKLKDSHRSHRDPD